MRRAALGAAIGAVVALAGCGEEDESGRAQGPLAKKDFIAKADRLCTAAGTKYDRVVASLPPFEKITAPDVPRRLMTQTGERAAEMAAIERDIERQLRALDPPEDFASRWTRAVDTLETRAKAAEDIEQASAAGDRKAYLEAFGRFDQAGTISTKALQGYGFKVCGAG